MALTCKACIYMALTYKTSLYMALTCKTYIWLEDRSLDLWRGGRELLIHDTPRAVYNGPRKHYTILPTQPFLPIPISLYQVFPLPQTHTIDPSYHRPQPSHPFSHRAGMKIEFPMPLGRERKGIIIKFAPLKRRICLANCAGRPLQRRHNGR